MDKVTHAFFNLFKHRITNSLNNSEVPVLITFTPQDNIPCITLNTASTLLIKQYRTSKYIKDYTYPLEVKIKEYQTNFLN